MEQKLIDPKEIWNKIGITDYNSNIEYYKKKKDNLTEEDLNILSPDIIDNHIFWENAPLIDDSSICGNGNTNQPKSWINKNNLWFLEDAGIINYINKNIIFPGVKILEIGPGFGSFYQTLPNYVDYIGYDNVPRFKYVNKTTPSGLIDSYFVEKYSGLIDLVISSNVFQHMSINQIKRYLYDIRKLLAINSKFILSMSHPSQAVYTAGQFILPIKPNELFNMVYDITNFHTISIWQQMQYNVTTSIWQKYEY